MRFIARRAMDVFGLAVVAVWTTNAVSAALERAGVSEIAALGLGGAGGAAAAVAVAHVARARRRRRRAVVVEQERAAGAALRLARPDRTRAILAGANDSLAVTDGDLYAGRHPDAARAAIVSSHSVRGLRPSWALSDAQHEAVDFLTDELGRATLVRGLDDARVEVVGVKDYVGFRYVVDLAGDADLVAADGSHALQARVAKWLSTLGFTMLLGSLGFAYALHPDGNVPGWMAPLAVGGLALAVIGLASSRGPRSFAGDGDTWHEFGSGWG